MIEQEKTCKVVSQNGFLQLAMPNGEIIPQQTDLTIKNPMSVNGQTNKHVIVSVECRVVMTVEEFLKGVSV